MQIVRAAGVVGRAVGLAAAVVIGLVVGSLVIAISGQTHVSIPYLLRARPGIGIELMELDVNPLGAIAWLVGLSVLFSSAGLVLMRGKSTKKDPQP